MTKHHAGHPVTADVPLPDIAPTGNGARHNFMRRLLQASPGLTAAMLGVVMNACSDGGGDFSEAVDRIGQPPAATAEPITGVPTTIEEALQDLQVTTTVQHARHVPTTTTTLAPPRETSPTTIKTPEVRPVQETLPIGERQMLALSTGYNALTNPAFDMKVMSRFSSDAADFVVVSVDEAEPVVQIDQLRHMIGVAEKIAAQRSNFTTSLKLSPSAIRDITFTAKPADIKTSQRDTRYILMTPDYSTIQKLTAPHDTSAFSGSALTVREPYQDMSLTMIGHMPTGTLRDGLPVATYDMWVEVFQMGGYVDIALDSVMKLDAERPSMSNLKVNTSGMSEGQAWQAQKDELARVGQDLWGISEGFAAAARWGGYTYGEYATMVDGLSLRSPQYSGLGAEYLRDTAAQYSVFPGPNK